MKNNTEVKGKLESIKDLVKNGFMDCPKSNEDFIKLIDTILYCGEEVKESKHLLFDEEYLKQNKERIKNSILSKSKSPIENFGFEYKSKVKEYLSRQQYAVKTFKQMKSSGVSDPFKLLLSELVDSGKISENGNKLVKPKQTKE